MQEIILSLKNLFDAVSKNDLGIMYQNVEDWPNKVKRAGFLDKQNAIDYIMPDLDKVVENYVLQSKLGYTENEIRHWSTLNLVDDISRKFTSKEIGHELTNAELDRCAAISKAMSSFNSLTNIDLIQLLAAYKEGIISKDNVINAIDMMTSIVKASKPISNEIINSCKNDQAFLAQLKIYLKNLVNAINRAVGDKHLFTSVKINECGASKSRNEIIIIQKDPVKITPSYAAKIVKAVHNHIMDSTLSALKPFYQYKSAPGHRSEPIPYIFPEYYPDDQSPISYYSKSPIHVYWLNENKTQYYGRDRSRCHICIDLDRNAWDLIGIANEAALLPEM